MVTLKASSTQQAGGQATNPGTTTTVIVPPAAPLAQEGCSCAAPNASLPVRGARGSAIAIIVVHAIHLFALGFYFAIVIVASLIAFIMGGVHLCVPRKCAYICAGIFYILGFIIDIVTVAGAGSAGLAVIAVPAALGMIAFAIGAVFSWMAVCKWEESGAAGPTVTQANAPSIQVTTTQQQAVPVYGGSATAVPVYGGSATAAAKSQPPPAYSGNV